MSQDDLELIEKLIAMPDSEIDYSDIPKGTGTFAIERIGMQTLFKPIKQQITLRLDGDIIAWAKREGEGYQSRINATLRKAMLDEIREARTPRRPLSSVASLASPSSVAHSSSRRRSKES